MKIYQLLLGILLSTTALADPKSETERPIVPTFAMTFAKVKGLETNGPLPVLYFLDGSSSPSCGLVLNKQSKSLLPVMETEDQASFPFCAGFTDAATFEFESEKYAVFRYQQRDTRPEPGKAANDPYSHFIVRYNSKVLTPIEDLNAKESSADKTSAQAISKWALEEFKKNKKH